MRKGSTHGCLHLVGWHGCAVQAQGIDQVLPWIVSAVGRVVALQLGQGVVCGVGDATQPRSRL